MCIRIRGSAEQLGKKVLPFIFELSACHRYAGDDARVCYECGIEMISPINCIRVDFDQIRSDGIHGRMKGAKTAQLRMPGVSACFTGQHSLGKQRFAPKGDQALRVEVSGVERPKTHECKLFSAGAGNQNGKRGFYGRELR